MSERGNPVLRLVDEVAGPILLRAASFLPGKRVKPDAPKHIGVICFGALGDLLLLSSVIGDIQSAYPDARVTLFGSGTNKAIAKMLPVAPFVELPVKRPDKALKVLRSLKIDVLVDSTQWARMPALLCKGSGAYTIGFRTAGQRRHFAYDAVVEHRDDIHEIENFRALVGPIAATSGTMPRMVVEDSDVASVANLALGAYAVLHAWPAGTRAELKEWPAENWAAVAHHLHKVHGLSVVLTGAPVDAQKSAALAKAIGPGDWVHDLAGKLKLPETVALLEQAKITVSVNTGIMHMAATFDVPLVGLSGPTNPGRWGPLSERSRSPKPDCNDCWYLDLGFEYPESPPDCMGKIAPRAVIEAIDDLL